jgi:hypothetical protein
LVPSPSEYLVANVSAVNILVDTGHQIIKLLMVHAEISNSADPDTGKLLQWMQELQPHLLRIENCEAEAADMLRQVGIMNPQTMVTQRIVDVSTFFPFISLIYYIVIGDLCRTCALRTCYIFYGRRSSQVMGKRSNGWTASHSDGDT